MINHSSQGNYFDAREEEATPLEIRDMAYNMIALAVLATILLTIAALPFII